MRVMMVFLSVLAGLAPALVSPDLAQRLECTGADRLLPVNIVLAEQFDPDLLNSLVEGMPGPARRAEVYRVLGEFSSRGQQGLVAWLAAAGAQNVTPLWLVNAVHCEATTAVVRAAAERPEVAYVSYDLVPSPGLAAERGEPAPAEDEIPWGVQRISAPAVWAEGYTGQDVVVGIIDTGCDYGHPDLADHMWTDPNYLRPGWDFENSDEDPMDEQGHGTYTAGVVGSDGTSGSQCGAAPDAMLMALRVRTTADSVAESQNWQAMQFCVAPPLSPTNGADLYVNTLGWQVSWNPQLASWRIVANAVWAAGVSQIASAGADRGVAPPNAVRCPARIPAPWWNPENTGTGALSGVVGVGATDSSDNVTNFSSPGPATWQNVVPFSDYPYPPGLTKPDVSAPGVSIKTSQLGGGYATVTGTSWSTAFAAGAAALMLSKDSTLSPATVDSVLEVTALDRGPSGKDNDYGAGRIDALAAVRHLSGLEELLSARTGLKALAVAPTPFHKSCHVTGVVAGRVEVADASGRRVAALSVPGNWLPGSEVKPGVYFFRAPGAAAAKVTYTR